MGNRFSDCTRAAGSPFCILACAPGRYTAIFFLPIRHAAISSPPPTRSEEILPAHAGLINKFLSYVRGRKRMDGCNVNKFGVPWRR